MTRKGAYSEGQRKRWSKIGPVKRRNYMKKANEAKERRWASLPKKKKVEHAKLMARGRWGK